MNVLLLVGGGRGTLPVPAVDGQVGNRFRPRYYG